MDNEERKNGERPLGIGDLDEIIYELNYLKHIRNLATALQKEMFGANKKSDRVNDFSNSLSDEVSDLDVEIEILAREVSFLEEELGQ